MLSRAEHEIFLLSRGKFSYEVSKGTPPSTKSVRVLPFSIQKGIYILLCVFFLFCLLFCFCNSS